MKFRAGGRQVLCGLGKQVRAIHALVERAGLLAAEIVSDIDDVGGFAVYDSRTENVGTSVVDLDRGLTLGDVEYLVDEGKDASFSAKLSDVVGWLRPSSSCNSPNLLMRSIPLNLVQRFY